MPQMQGNAAHVLYVWDYHHGQATRVVVGGCPPLRGRTMAERQEYLARHHDRLRALVCREPRGHRNMLGAFVTEPVTPDGDAGVIFVHPEGYFEACGDSTFSAAVALLESGMVPRQVSDGQQTLRLDTVAGRIEVRATLRGGRVVSVAMRSVPSFALGSATLAVDGLGELTVELGWGGLLYAFVPAQAVGVCLTQRAARPQEREKVIEVGTRLWEAARDQLASPIPGVASRRPVDLVTLYEDRSDHEDGGGAPGSGETRRRGGAEQPGQGTAGMRGARVANFYGPRTMGRTPSGTGIAARAAILHATGRLGAGEPYYHESPLGLRFVARVVQAGPAGTVSEVETMSYLMGIATLVVRDDDPFPEGFTL